MRRENLQVEIHALAHRVLMQDKRAVGVEYKQHGVLRRARARREVLLSGGSINSPQLLQLSGIGPAPLLQSFGIGVVHDLPGVGENLQDHCSGRTIYRCAHANTINEVSHSLWLKFQAGLQYLLLKRGTLMMGAGPIGLFVRTREGLESPDVQYQFLAGSTERAGGAMHDFPGCSLGAIPCRPESRGWLRLKSPDPTAPPAIQPNYLSTQADKDTMVAGLRIARKVMNAPSMRALVTDEVMPGSHRQTDEELLEHVRETSGTTYHPTSSCMMGPQDMAVVDSALRVKGVGGLRVIDASIMPTVVSGNTNATAIMIAEKGADMVLRA